MPVNDIASADQLSPEMRAALRDLMAWRRDVRRFKPAPIDRAHVLELLHAAQLSPSVGNSQPWRFVMVDDVERRAAVRASFVAENAAAASQQPDERRDKYLALKLAGLDAAPVQIAVFCDHAVTEGHRLGRMTMPETLDYSVVCAIHALWLLARAGGLGIGWVSILDPQAVKAALDVPEAWKLIAYLCLGEPEETHLDPELVRHNWQQRLTPETTVLQR
jgi:5,6-dimethylbenzimidazole synthase